MFVNLDLEFSHVQSTTSLKAFHLLKCYKMMYCVRFRQIHFDASVHQLTPDWMSNHSTHSLCIGVHPSSWAQGMPTSIHTIKHSPLVKVTINQLCTVILTQRWTIHSSILLVTTVNLNTRSIVGISAVEQICLIPNATKHGETNGCVSSTIFCISICLRCWKQWTRLGDKSIHEIDYM